MESYSMYLLSLLQKNKEIMTLLNSTLVIPWSVLEQAPHLSEKWGKV